MNKIRFASVVLYTSPISAQDNADKLNKIEAEMEQSGYIFSHLTQLKSSDQGRIIALLVFRKEDTK